MSCDKLVFDLSQEVEGSPNVFIRKDWINILDNQNQNYQNNQSIIDTSQLSNSNKYMGYREAYLAVPMLLTMVSTNVGAAGGDIVTLQTSEGAAFCTSYADYSIGLKNWFGTIIHSFTLDYNGTTIIQQTPFCNMWNSFKLMTTLSYNDILTQGPTIGFYPDTPSAFTYVSSDLPSTTGKFVCNNDLSPSSESYSTYKASVGQRYIGTVGANNGAYAATAGGNFGLTKRISWINYNPDAGSGPSNGQNGYKFPQNRVAYINAANTSLVWKSYISKQTNSGSGANAVPAVMQISLMATIYLKHVHSFFNMVPLLKGSFMKMTMNLNNSSTTVSLANTVTADVACPVDSYTSNTFVGGVNPLLIPSGKTGSYGAWKATGIARSVYYNISVGATITDNTILALPNIPGNLVGTVAKSVYLYVPAYTFNPTFEQAYLSVSPKVIKYTDIYQYQVLNVAGPLGQFNNLITNGIANIKSILIIPFFNKSYDSTLTASSDYIEYQSPFDPAGTSSTAPMVSLGNFNVQISGQNAIYNMQRYGFEEFNNQLYGQNAVNGGLTDGLTSGLINFDDFQRSSCYYYINVERMLPVEQSVPKSVQILGTNYSQQSLNFWVFIEYGCSVAIDILTGARV